MKRVFEKRAVPGEIISEDGGQSLILEVGTNGDEGVYVRVHSFSETLAHDEFQDMLNKRVRITIETVDD